MKRAAFPGIACLSLLVVFSGMVIAKTENNPYETDLIAAQSYDAGSVKVWNDEEFIYVKYELDIIWIDLVETHVHIATSLEDIPQNNQNPAPGQFDYQAIHDRWEQEYTHVIPLDPEWEDGELLFVAAHAVITGNCGLEETCWGDGTPFQGTDSWGTWFNYVLQIGPPLYPNFMWYGRKFYESLFEIIDNLFQ